MFFVIVIFSVWFFFSFVLQFTIYEQYENIFFLKLSSFPACFENFWALTSFGSDEAFDFQIGEGGCVGTYYNGQVK